MTTPPYYGPPQPTWGPPPAAKPSRVPLIVAFVGIFIAIALGVVALFRPVHTEAAPPREPPQQYTDQEIADAKEAVCGAYEKTKMAITGAATQSSTDPTVTFVIAVNTRLSTQLSSRYMSKILEQNPATPHGLSSSVRNLTGAWDEIVLAQLSGTKTDAPELKSTLANLDLSDVEISQACQ